MAACEFSIPWNADFDHWTGLWVYCSFNDTKLFVVAYFYCEKHVELACHAHWKNNQTMIHFIKTRKCIFPIKYRENNLLFLKCSCQPKCPR